MIVFDLISKVGNYKVIVNHKIVMIQHALHNIMIIRKLFA
jgi:hypothetical protein